MGGGGGGDDNNNRGSTVSTSEDSDRADDATCTVPGCVRLSGVFGMGTDFPSAHYS